MPYTPEDLVNVELKQSVRGYSIPQVDALLDELADQIETSEREIADLRGRIRDAEARLASALETESTLKRTLVTAQQAAESALDEARAEAAELRSTAGRDAERMREEAQQEAQSVVEEARSRAAAETEDARQQRTAIETRIDALRDLEARHRRVLRAHLQQQQQVLDQLELPDDDPRQDVGEPAWQLPEPPVHDHQDAAYASDPEASHDAADMPGLRVRVHPPSEHPEG